MLNKQFIIIYNNKVREDFVITNNSSFINKNVTSIKNYIFIVYTDVEYNIYKYFNEFVNKYFEILFNCVIKYGIQILIKCDIFHVCVPFL